MQEEMARAVLTQLGNAAGTTFDFPGSGIVGCRLERPRPMDLPYLLQRVSYSGEIIRAPSDRPARQYFGYVLDRVTGEQKLVDLNEPDPDVLAAYAALSDFRDHLPSCARSTYGAENVALDLYGSEPRLNVQLSPSLRRLDPDHRCIPAQYEGVSVEQTFVQIGELE